MRAALLSGFERVLLDGGPCRAFVLDDYQIVQEDFISLLNFFAAQLDGVDVSVPPRHKARALLPTAVFTRPVPQSQD